VLEHSVDGIIPYRAMTEDGRFTHAIAQACVEVGANEAELDRLVKVYAATDRAVCEQHARNEQERDAG
jgi:hypothetical protein